MLAIIEYLLTAGSVGNRKLPIDYLCSFGIEWITSCQLSDVRLRKFHLFPIGRRLGMRIANALDLRSNSCHFAFLRCHLMLAYVLGSG